MVISGEITQLLHKWCDGERAALDEALEKLMPDLRAIAHTKLNDEFRASDLQTTELLNQACVVILGIEGLSLASRRHFCQLAAQKMSFFLIDEARKRNTPRHGGGWTRIQLQDALNGGHFPFELIIALREVLEQLKEDDPELYAVVEIRGIAGFQEKESAEILGLPLSSFKRKWVFARALLSARLKSPEPS